MKAANAKKMKAENLFQNCFWLNDRTFLKFANGKLQAFMKREATGKKISRFKEFEKNLISLTLNYRFPNEKKLEKMCDSLK